jgi:RNA polymerase primary sigma factor
VSRYLVQELGREPTPEEIAEKMGMPVEENRRVFKIPAAYLARNAYRRRW